MSSSSETRADEDEVGTYAGPDTEQLFIDAAAGADNGGAEVGKGLEVTLALGTVDVAGPVTAVVDTGAGVAAGDEIEFKLVQLLFRVVVRRKSSTETIELRGDPSDIIDILCAAVTEEFEFIETDLFLSELIAAVVGRITCCCCCCCCCNCCCCCWCRGIDRRLGSSIGGTECDSICGKVEGYCKPPPTAVM